MSVELQRNDHEFSLLTDRGTLGQDSGAAVSGAALTLPVEDIPGSACGTAHTMHVAYISIYL